MKRNIALIFILSFLVVIESSFCQEQETEVVDISYKNNSREWHTRNEHLIPDVEEAGAILSLKQKRDFKSNDIDEDGIVNNIDPSPYDWREVGYQPFGVLAFLPWKHDWNNEKYTEDEDLKKAVKLLKEVNVAFVRMDFLWQDIEPENDKFDFEKYDLIVELLSKENIRILGILGYSVSWAGKDWNYPPDNLEDFIDFISNVITRYKDRIKYWEIWNEPDSNWQPQDDMKTYTNLLKASYKKAKEIDPSCRIVLGGMTGEGFYAIKNVYRNGGKDYFDIINIHPFVNPLNPNDIKRIYTLYNNLERLKVQNNDTDKKIWFTEIGCPGITYKVESKGWWEGTSPTEKQQAKFLHTIYTDVVELANVEKIFWAYFRDNKDYFKNDVDYFGFIRWDFSKKPAYNVFKRSYARWYNLHNYFKLSKKYAR